MESRFKSGKYKKYKIGEVFFKGNFLATRNEVCQYVIVPISQARTRINLLLR